MHFHGHVELRPPIEVGEKPLNLGSKAIQCPDIEENWYFPFSQWAAEGTHTPFDLQKMTIQMCGKLKVHRLIERNPTKNEVNPRQTPFGAFPVINPNELS